MPAYVDQCCELFPDKPIVMGVYLRDYAKVAPIPVDRVKNQMEGIAHLIHLSKYIPRTFLIFPLIMNSIDFIIRFKVASSSKDVYFMTPSSQSFGKL
jgi:hypothetical protein